MKEFATLFEQARALPEKDRATFLERACKGDASLRQKIERMLSAAAQADAFFGENSADDADATLMMAPVPEGPGSVIGRYKLLQKIGEGGMGVVYMAEQTEPVTRKVALKIIKVGMDTRRVIARFEAERQALAMMDHPNIAHVLDGGATDSGRPYFVMELVQGVPITEFCDKNKLSARERIDLFIPVCHAIQSAHQKGIIHRDIKPSNVLVTLNHGEPVPKVIDFGIAKATNQKLTEKTLFTNFATMIGTPAYMSPEQAELSSMDVDTRADVYSLGVLLYELLTGSTPFPEKRLRSVGYGEMQRIIVEEDPPKPSERLRTLTVEEKTTLSKTRGIAAPAFDKLLKGDLDWIVMKCLEKDRRRRYDGPNELAADLKRHLTNEPVSAAAPSFAYQLQKLYQRNRPAVAMAATIAVILILATIASVAMAFRALRAEKAQALEAAHAREQTAVARAVESFINDDLLGQADPGNAEFKEQLTMRELLDRAAQKIPHRFVAQPQVEASIRATVGSAYLNLGFEQKAEEHFKRSLELLRNSPASVPDDIVAAMLRLADSQAFGRGVITNSLLNEAYDLACRTLPATNRSRLAATHLLGAANIAAAFRSKGALPQPGSGALKMVEESYRLRNQVFGIFDDDTSESVMFMATDVLAPSGRVKEAEDLILNAIRARKSLYPSIDPKAVGLKWALGGIYISHGKFADAETVFGDLVDEARKSGRDASMSIGLLHNYAGALRAQNKNPAQVERIYSEILQICRDRYGANSALVIQKNLMLGSFYLDQGKVEKAGPLLSEAYAGAKALAIAGPADPFWEMRRDTTRYLGLYFQKAGNTTRAAELQAEVLRENIQAGKPWLSDDTTFVEMAKALGGEDRVWPALANLCSKYPNESFIWSSCSIFALALKNKPEATRCADEMLQRFAITNDWSDLDRSLKAALLVGFDPRQHPSLTTFANALTSELSKPNFPAWGKVWAGTCLALYEYRSGDPRGALEILNAQVLNEKNHGFKNYGGHSLALTVAAMSHFHLGDIPKATALLEEASSFPEQSPTKWHQSDPKTLPADILRFVLLRSEAAKLIGVP